MPNPSIAFIWTEINGYATACIKSLIDDASSPVRLWAGSVGTTHCHNAHNASDLHEDWCTLIPSDSKSAVNRLVAEVSQFRPDVLFLGGWNQPWCKSIIRASDLARTKIVLMVDNPWRGDLRQRAAPIALRAYVQRCSAVLVPGERAWQFARYIGFPEGRIFKGLYGVDSDLLRRACESRSRINWPKEFVFVGQLIERKGVDELCQGYQHYHANSSAPWPLTLAGDGPLREKAEGIEGIRVKGFLQPNQLSEELTRSGCFILSSRYDAWPLAIVEACISGLPIICTTACGSAVENVRDWYNGRIIQPSSAKAISRALTWAESNYNSLPTFGERSQELAGAFTSEQWSMRVQEIAKFVVSH